MCVLAHGWTPPAPFLGLARSVVHPHLRAVLASGPRGIDLPRHREVPRLVAVLRPIRNLDQSALPAREVAGVVGLLVPGVVECEREIVELARRIIYRILSEVGDLDIRAFKDDLRSEGEHQSLGVTGHRQVADAIPFRQFEHHVERTIHVADDRCGKVAPLTDEVATGEGLVDRRQHSVHLLLLDRLHGHHAGTVEEIEFRTLEFGGLLDHLHRIEFDIEGPLVADIPHRYMCSPVPLHTLVSRRVLLCCIALIFGAEGELAHRETHM